MKFVKMHGAGNDYVYVDCFSQQPPADPARLAPKIADRHFGVGGDGLILIRPSEVAAARMQMFNADGSEAEMCGNGLRCVAKYVFDHGICRDTAMDLETGAGVLSVEIEAEGKVCRRVKVDMGEPILEPAKVPTTLVAGVADNAADPIVEFPLDIGGKTFPVTCVSMGNPHAVIFVEQATDELVLGVGPQIETDACFPARVNVEFVEVLSPTELRQRTWERGSGETWACGTGASAVCVAGVLAGKSDRKVLIHLLGGDLELEWDAKTNHLLMTGPAAEVFTGEWPVS